MTKWVFSRKIQHFEISRKNLWLRNSSDMIAKEIFSKILIQEFRNNAHVRFLVIQCIPSDETCCRTCYAMIRISLSIRVGWFRKCIKNMFSIKIKIVNQMRIRSSRTSQAYNRSILAHQVSSHEHTTREPTKNEVLSYRESCILGSKSN